MTSIADLARRKLSGEKKQRTTSLGDSEMRVYILGNLTAVGDSLIIEEFGIANNKARADLAYVRPPQDGWPGVLGGMEIKSNLDSIKRLANQALHYTQFFEECSIIVGHKFMKHALSYLPQSWGVWALNQGPLKIEGTLLRRAETREVSYYNWLDLLWREEVLDHFRADSTHSNLTRVTKQELVDEWKNRHSPLATREIVLRAIYNRKDWRRRDQGTLHR